MKTIYALATVALFAAGAVNAQAPSPCAQALPANAKVIAAAQAAATPALRMAVLKKAIDANPANAVCLADLALQMSLNINPAAGPEDAGTVGETPNTTDGATPPAENPNQLNQPAGTTSASPASPAI